MKAAIVIAGMIHLGASSAGLAANDTLEAERKAVAEVERGFFGAVAAKDGEKVLSYLADDALVLTSKRQTEGDRSLKDAMPVRGKEAISKLNDAFFASTPGLKGTTKPFEIVVSKSADLAYVFGDFEATFDGPEGRLIDRGRYVLILRKNAGKWEIVGHGGTTGVWELLEDAAEPVAAPGR